MLSTNITFKTLIYFVFDLKRRSLIKNTPGLTSFYDEEVKPTNGSFIFKSFSKGDQVRVKLANIKFSEIGDGP